MCDKGLDKWAKEYIRQANIQEESMESDWRDKQYTCNRTKREQIFIGLDMILTAGDRIEYNYDRKTDSEVKEAVLKYADILNERADELRWMATNMIVYGDDSVCEDTEMIEKMVMDFDER